MDGLTPNKHPPAPPPARKIVPCYNFFMPPDINERIAFLRTMGLFAPLKDDQVAEVAHRLKTRYLSPGETLYAAGNLPANFYIVHEGCVGLAADAANEPAPLDSGEYFGEEELLFNRRRTATVAALDETRLFYLTNPDFDWLVEACPQVKEHLNAVADAHAWGRRLGFHWLAEGEVFYLISRRHPAKFGFALFWPISMVLLAVAAWAFAIWDFSQATQGLGVVLGGAATFAALVWAAWDFFDWLNDYFILTNQRVAWLENLVLVKSSRKEVPLQAIRSIDVKSSQIGRWLNYGDVILRTYTGSLTLSFCPNPRLMKELITEQIMNERRKAQQARLEVIRQSVRQSLGAEGGPPPAFPEPSLMASMSPARESFTGFRLFKTREFDGVNFTYHKHWFALVTGVWVWLAAAIGVAAVLGWMVWRNVFLQVAYPPLATIIFFGLLLLCAPLAATAYKYYDWRDDIYKVTKDSIIDSEKKPLGTEVSKSAPLRNVLSLEHKRVGLLGLLLNVGVVRINVGDTMLEFLGVHDPAQVQQDIYYRMETLKRDHEQQELQSENRRLGEWIKAYEDYRAHLPESGS